MRGREKNADKKKELISEFLSLFRENWARGYSPGIRQRSYEVPGTGMKGLRERSVNYLKNAIEEEKRILADSKRRPTEYALEMRVADEKLQKAYGKYSNWIEKREAEEQRRLERMWIEFDDECFERQMEGLEQTYAGFDAEASVRETNEFNYRKEMCRMRKRVERKLRDYSHEAYPKHRVSSVFEFFVPQDSKL